MGIYIGFSSNLDDPAERIAEAVWRLEVIPGIRIVRMSSLYRTAPWGYADQPEFYNLVAEIETNQAPRELLMTLQSIEADMGRIEPPMRYGPRRIDLDLLVYRDETVDEPDLKVPHPRMLERAFVLAPMEEIAPDEINAATGQTYLELWKRFAHPGEIRAVEPSPRATDDRLMLVHEGGAAEFSVVSESPERTHEIGEIVGALLAGGETIALNGPLGAGKTCMIQGIAEALAVRESVSSPTYLIHRSYRGRLRMDHFDFYRLEQESDLDSIQYYDLPLEAPDSVRVIEWANKFPDALEEPILSIRISPLFGSSPADDSACGSNVDWRTISFHASGASAQLLRSLFRSMYKP